jgi:Pentatricopeptide repeat domain
MHNNHVLAHIEARSFSSLISSSDDDLSNRSQRKVLLDAINHTVKKQKHFWTVEQLNIQTQRLLDYCNDRDNSDNHAKPIVKKKNSIDTKSTTTFKYGRPSSNTFFDVLEAWMERSMIMAEQQNDSGDGTINCAEQARLLLDAMLPKRDMYQPHIIHDNTRYVQNTKVAFLKNLLKLSHYEVVLQAYAVSNGGLPAAIRAESLLSQMIQRCRSYIKTTTTLRIRNNSNRDQNRSRFPPRLMNTINNNSDRPPEPTLKTFNIVLNCWAKSSSYEAADRVMALLILMEQWHESYTAFTQQQKRRNSYAGCLPNERSILCLIEAWTNGRPNEAPEVTLRILQEVMMATDEIRNSTEPTSVTTDGIIKSGKYRNVQLDEAVFNAVIYAWVRCNRGRTAAIRAEEILQMMIQWSQVSNNSKNNLVRPVVPTTRTYSMIIMAWAECETIENKGDAAQRAETILMKMVQLYSEGKHNVKPNSLLFTSCIVAWSRAASNCNEAPDRAEQLWSLLRNLYAETGSKDIELEPTTQSGNAVISAWSRCTSRHDSVERALGALEILKQENKDDLVSYNTLLDAMSKKGYAQHAMKLLRWLEDGNDRHHHKLAPDLVSYNSVLAAFGRSTTTVIKPDDAIETVRGNSDTTIPYCVAEEAERLLRRMEQMERLKPDKKSYTCKFFCFLLRLTI